MTLSVNSNHLTSIIQIINGIHRVESYLQRSNQTKLKGICGSVRVRVQRLHPHMIKPRLNPAFCRSANVGVQREHRHMEKGDAPRM